MISGDLDPLEIRRAFMKIIDECGLDEDKWREYLNDRPRSQRSMSFSFDSDKVKDAFNVKLNFIVTRVELEVHEKFREEVESDMK